MKKVFSVMLCAVLLICTMASISSVSASSPPESGKLIRIKGTYDWVVGAANGIIVCAKAVDDEYLYGAVDYYGKTVVPFEYASASVPDEFGNFCAYTEEEECKFFNNIGEVVYTIDAVDFENLEDAATGEYLESLSEGVAVFNHFSSSLETYNYSLEFMNLADESKSFTVETATTNADVYPLVTPVSNGYSIIYMDNKIKVVDVSDGTVQDVDFTGEGDLMVGAVNGQYSLITDSTTNLFTGATTWHGVYLLNVETLVMTSLDDVLPYMDQLYSEYSDSEFITNINSEGILYDENLEKVGFINFLNFSVPTKYYDEIMMNTNHEKYTSVYDDGQYFYLDNEKNETGDYYLDATVFSDGIAAVTEDDGLTYVIDDNFNEISSKVNMGGSCASIGGNIFVTYNMNTEMATLYKFTTDSEDHYLGDIDLDDSVSVSDVIQLRKLIMSGASEDETMIGRCDLDGDMNVSVSDIITLRKLIMQG